MGLMRLLMAYSGGLWGILSGLTKLADHSSTVGLNKLPTPVQQLFLVSNTTPLLGIWDHKTGNYGYCPNSIANRGSRSFLASALAQSCVRRARR